MKRILFVDDDPALLAGLQNVLHKDRKRWNMEFVVGGQAALAALEIARYDCVVTDLKMPVVDGAAVLAVVRREHPTTRCVLLSGSDCVKAAGDVDETLAKPCSASMLRATLERLLR